MRQGEEKKINNKKERRKYKKVKKNKKEEKERHGIKRSFVVSHLQRASFWESHPIGKQKQNLLNGWVATRCCHRYAPDWKWKRKRKDGKSRCHTPADRQKKQAKKKKPPGSEGDARELCAKVQPKTHKKTGSPVVESRDMGLTSVHNTM